MPRYINQAKKDEVLLAIKNGMAVTQAAITHGVSCKAIYVWLRAQADNTGTSSLEVARLRRENQELKEIIGMFALEEQKQIPNISILIRVASMLLALTNRFWPNMLLPRATVASRVRGKTDTRSRFIRNSN